MKKVLLAAGFGMDLTELIMFCITSTKLSIIWNNKCLDEFQPSRGIRQGDPLAPYLFLLCMDVLSQKIKDAVGDKRWVPVSASRGGPKFSHAFFADDLLLFGEATETQAIVMDEVISDFCHISGQKVSLAKSVFYVSKNTPAAVAHNIHQRMKMRRTEDIGKYLGVPMLHRRVTPDT